MAVTHSGTAKNSIGDAILTDVGNAGKVKLLTASNATIISLTLPTPAGTVASAGAGTPGLLTFDCDPDISATAALTGAKVATKAIITTAADATILSCSAGTAGDITLSSATINNGDKVVLQTLTYEPPA